MPQTPTSTIVEFASWASTRWRGWRTATVIGSALAAGCIPADTGTAGVGFEGTRILADMRRLAAEGDIPADGVRLSIDPADPPRSDRPGRRRRRGSLDPLMVAARAARAATMSGEADALQSAALAELRWGDTSVARYGRVIEHLEAAARTSAASAPILADLAAAHLGYAERTGDGQALVGALEAAAQAVERAPNDAQPRFVLTLGLHRAGLTAEAGRSASVYLRRDSTSQWADAMRAIARASLSSPAQAPPGLDADPTAIAAFARRDHEAAREYGWSVVLTRWADAVLAGDTARAKAACRLADRVGRALVDDGGDASLLDLAARVSDADRRTAVLVARAHRAFVSGDSSRRAGDFAQARAALERGVVAPGAPPILRWWASAALGATHIHDGRTTQGKRELRRLLAEVDAVRYPALAGRALASLGTAAGRSGDAEEVDRLATAAERHLRRAGEVERLGAVQALRADDEFGRGAGADGYASAWRALLTLRPRPHTVWRHNTLYVLAQEALLDDMPHAAAIVQDEGIDAAQGTGEPLDLAEALLARSRLRAARGDRPRAAGDIARAAPLIVAAPPGSARGWLEADLHQSTAQILLPTNPGVAAAHADSAVTFFAHRDVVLRHVTALTARAEAHAAMGADTAAIADLTTIIRRLDARAIRLRHAQARAVLLSGARRVLDRLVLMRLAGGDPRGALAELERVRALLAAAPVRATPPNATSPRGETAVVFARVADTLLTWTVTGTSTRLVRQLVPAADLDRTIARTVDALERRQPDSTVRPLLSRLYGTLIAPVAGQLGASGTPVVLVTDGALAAVPFAALYDATRGRYLVQDHRLRFASSLRDAAGAAPAPRRASAVSPVLLVGDPAFAPRAYPLLRRLPAAAAEVASLAGVYPGAAVLTGAAATAPAVTDRLTRARLVHYAGHAVFDAGRPERSHLVLAPGGGMGRWDARTVARLPLGATRLVVLAGCQTLGTLPSALDGVAGLAGAFRAAGVHGVLGATWRVDDAATQPLMYAFHRAYASRGDGPEALRSAQLEMLQQPQAELRAASAWAAFGYVGQ